MAWTKLLRIRANDSDNVPISSLEPAANSGASSSPRLTRSANAESLVTGWITSFHNIRFNTTPIRTNTPVSEPITTPKASSARFKGTAIGTETICLDWYPEGLGLPYFASLRLACEGRRWRQRRRQVTGLLAEVRVLKNKLAPIGPAVELEIPLT